MFMSLERNLIHKQMRGKLKYFTCNSLAYKAHQHQYHQSNERDYVFKPKPKIKVGLLTSPRLVSQTTSRCQFGIRARLGHHLALVKFYLVSGYEFGVLLSRSSAAEVRVISFFFSLLLVPFVVVIFGGLSLLHHPHWRIIILIVHHQHHRCIIIIIGASSSSSSSVHHHHPISIGAYDIAVALVAST
ncbi:hypothetical protein PIB30_003055 [Stylosanthes scabra]|uniref:Uncharacterized protein n=1 Tax=Stylosanthes scabra TaxID=79078 RepID=A0ABU6X257_9FABA|nr:hypothetical protein [Stylosanthes scabra]